MMRWVAVIGVSVSMAGACAHADGTDQKPAAPPPVNEARPQSTGDAKAVADFNERVKAYAALHEKLEATLPALPKETDPETVTRHQRALEKLVLTARQTARPGDILTPEAQTVFRQLLARVFGGREGRELKAVILDENPGQIGLKVNSRYPDEVPLSTVPPQVLSALPPLPKALEYRFIGERLILLDVHAHTIADYMDNVFPG